MPCRFHPDREAAVKCSKLDIGYCLECLEDCMACTDPCGYCKFRTACIIWENCRKSPRRYQLEAEAKGNPLRNKKGPGVFSRGLFYS